MVATYYEHKNFLIPFVSVVAIEVNWEQKVAQVYMPFGCRDFYFNDVLMEEGVFDAGETSVTFDDFKRFYRSYLNWLNGEV